MSEHQSVCAIYQRSTLERLKELGEKNAKDALDHQKFIYENKIRKLEQELVVSKEQNLVLKTKLETAQTENERMRQDHQELALKCASKDTTTTTSTIINNSRNTVNNILNCLEAAGPLTLFPTKDYRLGFRYKIHCNPTR